MWTHRGRSDRYTSGMMIKLSLVHVLVVAIVPFALASPAAAAAGDDPCVTVSKADVAVALRGPVVDAKSEPRGLSQSCVFDGPGIGLVTVTASRGNNGADAISQFTTLTRRMEKMYSTGAPIAGIGDAAVGIRTAVYVRKGTAVYVFDVNGRPGPDTLARATALAKATLPRIKPQ